MVRLEGCIERQGDAPGASVLRLAFVLTAGVVIAVAAGAARAEAPEPAIKIESTIQGSQEQPKVLYIVPWLDARADEPLQAPMKPLIDERILAPLERSDFRRRLDYRRGLELGAEP